MNKGDGSEHLDLAAGKIAEHDISGALEALNQNVDETDGRWLELAGECHFRLGNFEQAQACWEQALKIGAANQGALDRLAEMGEPSFQFWMKRFNDAVDQTERKNYAAAMAMLQELKAEQDRFVRLYQLLGLCCLANGDSRRAQQTWRKGLEMDRHNSSLHSYLAAAPTPPAVSASVAAGRADSGAGEKKPLNTSLWIAGAFCLALLIMGVALHGQAGPMNVQQTAADIPDNPESDDTAAPPAVKAMVMDDFTAPDNMDEDPGDSAYDPSHERFYYLKGYNAYLEADYGTASYNLGVVAAMGTRSYIHREALYYLARVSYLQKDYVRAEQLYNDYLQLFPNSNYYDDSLFYLGCAYYYMGEIEKTRDCFQRLKELNQPVGYQLTPIYHQIMGE